MSFLGGHDDRHQANRGTAAVIGVLLVLFGLAAVQVGLGHPFAGRQGGRVMGLFGANLLSSVVHLLLGVVLLAAAAAGTARARTANRVVGGACLLLALYGLAAETTDGDLLAVQGGTNDLHLLRALVLVAVGVLADRTPTSGNGPRYRTVRH